MAIRIENNLFNITNSKHLQQEMPYEIVIPYHPDMVDFLLEKVRKDFNHTWGFYAQFGQTIHLRFPTKDIMLLYRLTY